MMITKVRDTPTHLRRVTHYNPGILDSAYIFVGGLHPELTEGDVITVFSQYVVFHRARATITGVVGMGRSWT